MKVRIARYAIISLLGVLVFAIALVLTLDFGRFKGDAEAWVSNLLQREFTIDGPLHLRIGRTIVFSAADVKLASADWSSVPTLASFRRIEARVDTWSLISGPIRLESLTLDGLRVNLEENKSGDNNWTFDQSVHENLPAEDSAKRPSLPVRPENIDITDAILVYANPDLKQPVRVTIDSAHTTILESLDMQLTLAGNINEIPVKLNLNAGKVQDLMTYTKLDLKLDGQVGEIQFEGVSAIANLLNPMQPTVSVKLSGPSVEYLTDILGLQQFTTGPLQLDVTLARNAGKMQLDLNGTIGEYTVRADGVADDFSNLDSATASLHIEGSDVGRFGQLLGLPGKLDGRFKLDVKLDPKAAGGGTISLTANAGDITLKVEGDLTGAPDLAGSIARIHLQAADFRRVAGALGIDQVPALQIDAGAVVQKVDGGLSIEDGSFVIGKDQVSFSGMVGDQPLQSGTDIRFRTNLANLSATLAEFDVELQHLPSGEFSAAGQLTAADERVILRNLTVSFAGMKAELEAKLSVASLLSDSQISFQVEGKDLSELLPPNEIFDAPDKAFSLDGSVRLQKNVVSLPDLQFRIGQNQLKADVQLGLEPALKSVKASIVASGPNLYELSPQFADFPDLKVAPFKIRSEIIWQDELLSIKDSVAQVGDAKLEVNGSIENPPNFDRTDLRLVLHIADMNSLSVFTGRDLPHDSADLSLRLLGEANTVTLEKFEGRFGDSDLSGDFSYRAGETPELKLKLVSKRLNLTPYLPPVELTDPPADPIKFDSENAEPNVEASASPAPDVKVIPDTPIPFDQLQGYVADVDIQIDELNLRQHTIQDLAVSAMIDDGSLSIEHFTLKAEGGGEFNGRLELKPKPDGAEIRMKMLGKKMELGLPAETEEDRKALPRYDLDLAFITSGGNTREMAAAVTGYLKLTSGKGRIKASSMQIFTHDFLFQLINTINPFTKSDPYTNLKCTTILATVEQGKITGKPIMVVQSERLNILASALIDLNTESLNAEINTVPQKGLGLSLSGLVNTYVRVIGTLAAPKLSLNKESVLIEGGAAVATGGISILALGLKDRFLSDKHPCKTAVSNAADDFAAMEAKHAGLRWPDLN